MLARYENNGIELVINQETGDAYATQAGYVRMSGVSQSTVSTRMNTQRFNNEKTAEILTSTGLKTVRLIPADTVFEWAMKDKPSLALAMGKAGATVFMHQLAGYKVQSQPTKVVLEQPPLVLPPPDVRVANLMSALAYAGFEVNNPRYSQGIKDLIGDILALNQNQKALESKEVWAGVAERAEQLGYAPGLVTRFRSALGRFVNSKGLECKVENRLCNGTERPVNLFKVTPQLDATIQEYMDKKI